MSEALDPQYPDVPLSVALVNSNLTPTERLWALQAVTDRGILRNEIAALKKELETLAILPQMFLLDDPYAPPGHRIDVLDLCKRLRTENELRNAAIAERDALKKELEEAQECFSLARGELYAIKTTPTEKNGANICGHDRSWITCFGTCMACRAEKAETQAAEAGMERDALKKELEIARAESFERGQMLESLQIERDATRSKST